MTRAVDRDRSGRTPSTFLVATCEALETATRAAIGVALEHDDRAAALGYYGRLDGIQRVLWALRGDLERLTLAEIAQLGRIKRTEKGGYRFR